MTEKKESIKKRKIHEIVVGQRSMENSKREGEFRKKKLLHLYFALQNIM